MKPKAPRKPYNCRVMHAVYSIDDSDDNIGPGISENSIADGQSLNWFKAYHARKLARFFEKAADYLDHKAKKEKRE